MYKIVHSTEGAIRQIADNKTANNLITKDISPDVSLATTKAIDYYEKEITSYNRIYFVLDGELELIINDEINALQKGDSCFIGKGTEYEMRGTFELVIVNQPAFGTEPEEMAATAYIKQSEEANL